MPRPNSGAADLLPSAADQRLHEAGSVSASEELADRTVSPQAPALHVAEGEPSGPDIPGSARPVNAVGVAAAGDGRR